MQDSTSREFVMSRNAIPKRFLAHIRCGVKTLLSYYQKLSPFQLHASSRRNCALLCSLEKYSLSHLVNPSCYCFHENKSIVRHLHSCPIQEAADNVVFYQIQKSINFPQFVQRGLHTARHLVGNIMSSFLHRFNVLKQHLTTVSNNRKENKTELIKQTNNTSAARNNNQTDGSYLSVNPVSNSNITSDRDGRMVVFILPIQTVDMAEEDEK